MSAIDDIRDFNRFYTHKLRLLDRHMPASPFPLPEARVLYELAAGGEQTAADIGRRLDMDKAHLSRIVARLKADRLVERRIDPAHARRDLLSLSPAGRHAFAELEAGTTAQLDTLLSPLGEGDRGQLVGAMQEIKKLLDVKEPSTQPVILRKPRPGDLGWIIHRQAQLYHQEYDWDWTYEGLVAAILGDFVANFDPVREDAWIAELDRRIVGSIFLMKSDVASTGKLRLLYVDPSARGHGLGKRLVRACVERARALGYASLTLWTNDILAAARKIYQAEGFQLVAEDRHHSFGKDLVGQTWTLDLERAS
ncbi:MarR family transcriptional regulator [Labrys sp. KNU-23]|uniref:bifunctional helix-turn-helix transcriptional regulator/GNAT family N-acetyltransferase n=1 Tax=Labrys sp. KNU-23 TaxID=2789216 RepID=UPI0011F09757|nr:bifunctional helix-turn-helix transcriptional regulator/GNAT family N-acetyltransferase [Labrys sp. KNU-23]QEN90859.1 MarR family transcriptional regulator [Labrys sp. KNU-23]